MRIKRVISAGLLVSTVACAIVATAVSAEAKFNTVRRYNVSTIKTYSTYVYGDYSKMYAAPGYTGVCATKEGYEGSYKEAYYYEYRNPSDSVYVLYRAYSDEGCDDVVISNTKKSVGDKVAERFQVGYIHLTSEKGSNYKDRLYCDIYKDTKEAVENAGG